MYTIRMKKPARLSAGSLVAIVGCFALAACPPTAPTDAGKDSTIDDAVSDSSAPDVAPDVLADVASAPDVFDAGVDSSPDVLVSSDADASIDTFVQPDVVATADVTGSDARGGLACGPITVVPAGGSTSFEITNSVGGAEPLLPCVRSPDAQRIGTNRSQRFQVTSASQVTIAHAVSLSDYGTIYAIAEDCAGPSPACLEATRYGGIITRLVMPGTYEVQKWGTGRTTVWIEPPVPAPTNTNCATATPLTLGSWASFGPRALDSNSRFFRWQSSIGASSTGFLNFRSPTSSAQATFVVRRGCGAGAVELLRHMPGSLRESSGSSAVPFTGVTPSTEYSIEVTAIQRGVSLEVMIN